MSARANRILRSTLLVGGLVFIYVGERLASPDGKVGWMLSLAGAVAVFAAAVVLRALAIKNANGERRRVETRIALASGGVVLSLVVYWLGTQRGLALLGVADAEGSKLPGVLAVAFPVLLVASLLPLLFMELSYASMPSEPSVERRRVDVSAQAGLAIALAIAALFLLGFAADGWGKKWDLSYFRTTRPSAATKRLVDRLGEPMEVYAYFPKVNDVRDQVMPYLRELGAASKKVRIKSVDHALRPALAREHRVTKNGALVLAQGEKHETVQVGLELEDARGKLRRLDGDFQKAFLKLTRPRRTLYVTTGHEERGDPDADDSEELGTDDWKTLLAEIGITTRTLGVGQGLASDIPDDATAVAMLGPRKKLLREEARALQSYVERGGHLLLLVDGEPDLGVGPLLSAFGLRLLAGTATSETNHLVRDHAHSDRSVVFSNRYSAHPTVTSASRLSSRVATVFVGGGAILGAEAGASAGVAGAGAATSPPSVTFTIRSMPGTWLDLDGDFTFDEGPEKKDNFNFVAAVSVRGGAPASDTDGEGRVVVVADGDFVTDQVLRNPGNVTVVADVLRWLVGEVEIPGPAESEEDVRIEHTRAEDVTWFYGTTFAMPALVLGVGLLLARRAKQARKPRAS